MGRKARHEIRNDGMGPYAIFYCDKCSREYRTQPDVKATVANDIGRSAVRGALKNVPLFGRAIADSVLGEDPRHSRTMSESQLDAAWEQAKENFRECPTCKQIVCLSDFDSQAGFCHDDSPRREQIAEARAEQAVGVAKGIASAFGLGAALQGLGQAAKQATAAMSSMARCPKDGTMAAPGTKFCPECGEKMTQPEAPNCPKCNSPTMGAKFCPNCGAPTKAAAAPANCGQCGAALNGAKFCPECGAKAG